MDVDVHGNPHDNYRLNGYQQTNDDGLQFLSVEEKECILFFEETIESLDEGFNETSGLTSRRLSPDEHLQASSNSAFSPVPAATIPPSLMENDIIDLVQSPTNFAVQDFQRLSLTPESHYEPTPERDPPSKANSDEHEENSYHPPPGSVPTPVIIASKIGEHQGAGKITPSTLLSRKRSLETKRDPSVPVRTPRLPSNINITRGNRDLSPHSIATAAVNLQERRSQMLANLPAGSHPLEGGEPACVRNLPMHSVSFKDTSPENSRLEALSKLGLVGDRTAISTASIVNKDSSSPASPSSSLYSLGNGTSSPQGSTYNPSNSATSTHISPYGSDNGLSSPVNSNYKVSGNANSASNGANKVSTSKQPSMSNNMKTSSDIPDITNNEQKNYNPTYTRQSSGSSEPKPKIEVSSNNFNYYGAKSTVIKPSTIQERRASVPPASAEVRQQTEFNRYGGKSVVLNPTVSVKAESTSSTSANTPKPSDTQYNSYGGRSRVINPAVNSDVPDGVNSAHSHSSTNSITPTTHHGEPTRFRYPSGQSSYDAKPKTSPLPPDPPYQPKVRSKSALPSPPPTASRPPPVPQRPRMDPVPAEILGKPAPTFRAQGVTVQFSGKGTTGEARRDALRRLGLLNKTS